MLDSTNRIGYVRLRKHSVKCKELFLKKTQEAKPEAPKNWTSYLNYFLYEVNKSVIPDSVDNVYMRGYQCVLSEYVLFVHDYHHVSKAGLFIALSTS